MGVTVTIDPAPSGSAEETTTPTFQPQIVGSIELNSLANDTESSAFSYQDQAGTTYATVTIRLNPITPTGSPVIQIISGSTGYELATTTTASIAREIKFVDIPVSFLASFTVKNKTGVALAASGNYVIVAPKY